MHSVATSSLFLPSDGNPEDCLVVGFTGADEKQSRVQQRPSPSSFLCSRVLSPYLAPLPPLSLYPRGLKASRKGRPMTTGDQIRVRYSLSRLELEVRRWARSATRRGNSGSGRNGTDALGRCDREGGGGAGLGAAGGERRRRAGARR